MESIFSVSPDATYLPFLGAPGNRGSFKATYNTGQVLGKGGFGVVYDGSRYQDSAPVAIKQVPNDKIKTWVSVQDCRVPLEVGLLIKLSHVEGVIKLLDYFDMSDHIIIVMERPNTAMDLFEYMSDKGFLDEKSAKTVFKKIVETTIACHKAGVVHRDIKSENILVDPLLQNIKLIDFGSGTILQNTMYTDSIGTKAFAPPEWILNQRYDGIAATVWSLGILLYDMVSGDLPFKKSNQLLKADLKFPSDISPDCKNLIWHCLRQRAEDRTNLQSILNHAWITD